MNALYTLNTDELNEMLLQTIKVLFPHKMIKLAIYETSNTVIGSPGSEYLTVDGNKKDIMDLYASYGMAPDYDYKQVRCGGTSNVSS